MRHAVDLSGLLLLYSSLGDAEGLTKLAALAKEQGKNNVAFVCLFMLGQVEDCLHLLVERYVVTVLTLGHIFAGRCVYSDICLVTVIGYLKLL